MVAQIAVCFGGVSLGASGGVLRRGAQPPVGVLPPRLNESRNLDICVISWAINLMTLLLFLSSLLSLSCAI